MKNKKQILITIALVVVYIAVLIAWHCYDPTDDFKLAEPGADYISEKMRICSMN